MKRTLIFCIAVCILLGIVKVYSDFVPSNEVPNTLENSDVENAPDFNGRKVSRPKYSSGDHGKYNMIMQNQNGGFGLNPYYLSGSYYPNYSPYQFSYPPVQSFPGFGGFLEAYGMFSMKDKETSKARSGQQIHSNDETDKNI
ncbi:uncharacterized protein LOC143916108 [Arctopsyche grandis]|uniref:uncharacterized protein LOC143916108 n=1 Tax=Arctopsyche grandis TaxID=121162 RepID=UPI00406DA3E7